MRTRTSVRQHGHTQALALVSTLWAEKRGSVRVMKTPVMPGGIPR
jgi:hypothetical protein